MKLFAGGELLYEVPAPAPLVLMLRPRSGAGQWVISEEYHIEPSIPVIEYTDPYGNLCQRLMAPEGKFKIQISLVVETADEIDTAPGAPFVPVQDLPDDTLQFLLPSRYCQSDRLGALAAEITETALPGYDQVEAIRNWIQTRVTYQYGTSDASTSAVETAEKRIGVCRDFAHLGISLCRIINIPARMVVGYLHLLNPMDLHAWFEAFIDGRWYTFDATQKEPRGNRIVVAYGRDAADVALATQYGAMTLQEMRVWVEEKKVDV